VIDVGPRSVTGVAFTEDQTGIVVSSDDGTLRWFPGPTLEFAPWALTRLTRGFKPNECRLERCNQLEKATANVVEGNRQATLGDERAAAAEYNAALKLVPGLPLRSRADAERVAAETRAAALRQQARGQLVQVETLARASRVDDARAVLEQLPPPMRIRMNIDAVSSGSKRELATALRGLAHSNARSFQEAQKLLTQAREVDATQVSDIENELALWKREAEQRAVTLVNSENIAEAVALLTSLRSDGITTPFDSDGRLANQLCWRGSLRTIELARDQEVRRACETAVTVTKGENSDHRDSRGLNRARNGDLTGAIDDFMTFVSDPTNRPSDRADRQEWINRLRRNENPFTTELLQSMR
jgi:hypothetical protein